MRSHGRFSKLHRFEQLLLYRIAIYLIPFFLLLRDIHRAAKRFAVASLFILPWPSIIPGGDFDLASVCVLSGRLRPPQRQCLSSGSFGDDSARLLAPLPFAVFSSCDVSGGHALPCASSSCVPYVSWRTLYLWRACHRHARLSFILRE